MWLAAQSPLGGFVTVGCRTPGGRLVSDTIRGWDARTVTLQLENAVGRDLQYIRVNGTLVGGLIGIGLHAIAQLL